MPLLPLIVAPAACLGDPPRRSPHAGVGSAGTGGGLGAGCPAAGACAAMMAVAKPNVTAAATAVRCALPMQPSSGFSRENGHCTPPMHTKYDAKCPDFSR